MSGAAAPGAAEGPAVRPHRIDTTLFTAGQIQTRVETLADEVTGGAGEAELVLVGILRGSFIFLADLVRAFRRRGVGALIDFMTLESYGGDTASCGEVRLAKDFSMDVQGASVLLVDDILDTGRTLTFAARHARARGAAAVRTCVLLDKPARRAVPFRADYVGFTVPDRFVVGYGLDYAGRYRDLPYLAELRLEEPPPR
jgi:hypoxanthine phosphoribosyltransferase